MRDRGAVLAALGVSWLGFAAHNLADLPGQTLLDPETALPTLGYLLLGGAWLGGRGRAATLGLLLLAWGWLHLLGGALLSVLPLPLWPFDPAQTLRHYAFHLLYGLAQVPLVLLLARSLPTAPAPPAPPPDARPDRPEPT